MSTWPVLTLIQSYLLYSFKAATFLAYPEVPGVSTNHQACQLLQLCWKLFSRSVGMKSKTIPTSEHWRRYFLLGYRFSQGYETMTIDIKYPFSSVLLCVEENK